MASLHRPPCHPLPCRLPCCRRHPHRRYPLLARHRVRGLLFRCFMHRCCACAALMINGHNGSSPRKTVRPCQQPPTSRRPPAHSRHRARRSKTASRRTISLPHRALLQNRPRRACFGGWVHAPRGGRLVPPHPCQKKPRGGSHLSQIRAAASLPHATLDGASASSPSSPLYRVRQRRMV